MRIRSFQIGLLFLATALSVAGVRAQQPPADQPAQDQPAQDQQQDQNQGAQSPQNNAPGPEQNQGQPEQPIPAYHSPLGTTGTEGENPGSAQYEPDTRPLAGAEDLSVGIPGDRRSNWAPYLGIHASGESNRGSAKGGWISYESVVGGINIARASRTSDFGLQYLGGGSFANQGNLGNTIVQSLGITENIRWRRNSLTVTDHFGYFPETSFGYGGVIGLPGLTNSIGGLQSVFIPGESILTAAGQRVTNASVVQLDTALSERSSFTLVGGYSFLHYFDNNLINYGNINVQGGYNYQMTRRDTIAVIYHFDEIRYSAVTSTIENHTARVSYGRRVTGKLAFQVAAGPEISFYPATFAGGNSTNSTSHISWSLNTALSYRQEERTTLGVKYVHEVSGGSGVFFGAETDRVSGSLNHQISAASNIQLTGGYAHNRHLTAAGVTSVNQSYDYWFGGANYARSLSPAWALTFTYELQYQQSNVGFCITPQCGKSYTRNVVSLGLRWSGRPTAF